MPFGPRFEPVWDAIEIGLNAAGYTATRGDSSVDQVNIVHDVLERISTSALILADLTGQNPNVIYELGVAHTKARRVVLLAEQDTSLPFNLQSYRVIEYRLDNAGLSKLAEDVRRLGRAAQDGMITFSNPVVDFDVARAVRFSGGGEPGINDIQESLHENVRALRANMRTVGRIVAEDLASLNRAAPATHPDVDREKSDAAWVNRDRAVRTRESELREFAQRMRDSSREATELWATFRSLAQRLANTPGAQGQGALVATVTSFREEVRAFLEASRLASRQSVQVSGFSAALDDARRRYRAASTELRDAYLVGDAIVAELARDLEL